MTAVSYEFKSPLGAEIYTLLGIPRFSNWETCEKAYETILRNCHPEQSMDEADTQGSMRKIIQLNNAIACIRSPAQKEMYDKKLLDCMYIIKLKAELEEMMKENANGPNLNENASNTNEEKNSVANVSSPPPSNAADTHPGSTGNKKQAAVVESRVKSAKKPLVEQKKTSSTHITKTGIVAKKVLAPLALLLTAGGDIAMAGAVTENNEPKKGTRSSIDSIEARDVGLKTMELPRTAAAAKSSSRLIKKDAHRNRHTKQFKPNANRHSVSPKESSSADVGLLLVKYQDGNDEEGGEHRHHHRYDHDPKYEGMMIDHDDDRSTHDESSKRHLQSLPTPTFTGDVCPPERQVVCENGMTEVNGTTLPCAIACGNMISGTTIIKPTFGTGIPFNIYTGGECCRGAGSCDYFTGIVCKDGISCSDDNSTSPCIDLGVAGGCGRACYKANITTVLRGCYHPNACFIAGLDGGYIGLVKDSCLGEYACQALANGGNISSISSGSCIGPGACRSAAGYGGYIGSITDGSCIGGYACNLAASNGGYSLGYIGNISSGSCIGPGACISAARFGGYIGSITDGSCIGDDACQFAARDHGYIGSITDGSCNGDSACSDAAYYGGYIGNIFNGSCNGDSACQFAGYGGYIGNIFNGSCNGNYTCYAAAYFGRIGHIQGGCIGYKACFYAAGCYGYFSGIDTTICQASPSPGNITFISSSCQEDSSCAYVAAGYDFPGSFVNGMYSSCNNESACYKAAFPGNIESGFYICCNTSEECKDVTEVTLPDTCEAPSSSPSGSPSTSEKPSFSETPSESPSTSSKPSLVPSEAPSFSANPSSQPSAIPSLSVIPSAIPSKSPSSSSVPSVLPSESPSTSSKPSLVPSEAPSFSTNPSSQPSAIPSLSSNPSISEAPSNVPSTSDKPSVSPSDGPSSSGEPSLIPSEAPSISAKPSSQPSTIPSLSSNPSPDPTSSPTQSPSKAPTASPSSSPSKGPTTSPSKAPTSSPTVSSSGPLDILSNVSSVIDTFLATNRDRGVTRASRDVEKAIQAIEDGNLKRAAREVEDAKKRLECNNPPRDQDPTIAEACQELSKIEFITDNVTGTLTVTLLGRRRLGKSQKQEFGITKKSAKTLQDTVTQIVTDSLSDVQGLDEVVTVSADNQGNGNLIAVQTLAVEELCSNGDCIGQNQSGETQVFQDVTGAINSAIATGEFTSVLAENVAKCGKECAQLVGATVTDGASFVSNEIVVGVGSNSKSSKASSSSSSSSAKSEKAVLPSSSNKITSKDENKIKSSGGRIWVCGWENEEETTKAKVAQEWYPLAEELAMIMKIMADEDVSDKIWVCGWENDDGSTKVGWEWSLAQELAKIMKIVAEEDGDAKN